MADLDFVDYNEMLKFYFYKCHICGGKFHQYNINLHFLTCHTAAEGNKENIDSNNLLNINPNNLLTTPGTDQLTIDFLRKYLT